MNNSSGSSEEYNADRNMDNIYCAHGVSDGNEDSTENWSKDSSFYIPAKNLFTVCSCPKTLVKLNLKEMVKFFW
jgi:hypothetical protein